MGDGQHRRCGRAAPCLKSSQRPQRHIVDALLAQRNTATSNKLAGIVVAATGNGTISKELEIALQKAETAGVTVWRSTRCTFGALIGKADVQFGDSGGLSPVKARIALMLQLVV